MGATRVWERRVYGVCNGVRRRDEGGREAEGRGAWSGRACSEGLCTVSPGMRQETPCWGWSEVYRRRGSEGRVSLLDLTLAAS